MRFLRNLYAQVLVAIVAGALLGHFAPATAVQLKPLGDAFVKLIKLVIAPLVFTTLVTGIGSVGDLRKVGRVGLKSLVYFEAVTTVALALGMLVVNVVRPGDGIHADPAKLDAGAVQGFSATAKHLTATEFVLGAIPDTFVGAFTSGAETVSFGTRFSFSSRFLIVARISENSTELSRKRTSAFVGCAFTST